MAHRNSGRELADVFHRSYTVGIVFKAYLIFAVIIALQLSALPGEGIEVDSRGIAYRIIVYRRTVIVCQQVAPAISVGIRVGLLQSAKARRYGERVGLL